jgi:hypothetical protein
MCKDNTEAVSNQQSAPHRSGLSTKALENGGTEEKKSNFGFPITRPANPPVTPFLRLSKVFVTRIRMFQG